MSKRIKLSDFLTVFEHTDIPGRYSHVDHGSFSIRLFLSTRSQMNREEVHVQIGDGEAEVALHPCMLTASPTIIGCVLLD